MENGNDLVWYACYGSNLLESRFLCYIKGGIPDGCEKIFTGCTDKTPPFDSEKCIIPYQLYFAKESYPWGGGGVAFLKSERLDNDEKRKTLGRKYLITKEQFVQVLRQENNKDINDSSIELDFNIFENKTQFLVGKENENLWYGRIIYLGEKKDSPIFTFTAKFDFDDYTLPSDNYLKKIINGLKETYKIKDIEIIDYLISIPGISDKKTQDELEKLVKES